jgi:hypothetical protein
MGDFSGISILVGDNAVRGGELSLRFSFLGVFSWSVATAGNHFPLVFLEKRRRLEVFVDPEIVSIDQESAVQALMTSNRLLEGFESLFHCS